MYRGLFLVILILIIPTPTYTDSVFELDLPREVMLTSAALGSFAASFLTSGTPQEQVPESKINGLDRNFMYPYRKRFDIIGTATACTALALPSISFYRQKRDFSAVATYSVMYCQAFFLVTGIKELMKDGISRWRPCSYDDDFFSQPTGGG